MLLLHVSVYLTPPSRITHVIVLKTICLYTAIIYGTLVETSHTKGITLWFTIFFQWLKSYMLHAILYVTNIKNLDDVTEETSNVRRCTEWNT
jgi:hypothetical protein